MKVSQKTLDMLAQAQKILDRGDRDVRQAISRKQVQAAKRAASPAGLAAIFPALKMGR